MQKNKTIAIDVDDVLAVSAKCFSEYSNKRWGLNTRPENYTEDWAKFWGVPLEKGTRWADDFHVTDAVYYYEHFQEALPVLRRLKERYRLIVLTSRRAVLKTHTDKWIQERFENIFEAIHYAGLWDSDADAQYKLKQTKAELCLELDASYLIDDQPKHCVAAHEAGVKPILFGDYSWNRNEVVPDGITRVGSWSEVERYFNAQS